MKTEGFSEMGVGVVVAAVCSCCSVLLYAYEMVGAVAGWAVIYFIYMTQPSGSLSRALTHHIPLTNWLERCLGAWVLGCLGPKGCAVPSVNIYEMVSLSPTGRSVRSCCKS